MPEKKNDMLLTFGFAVVAVSILTALYVLLWWSPDPAQEGRHIFGATYMTMNNPYYEVIDSQLRAIIEENGDVLVTRDAAMNQKRQNQEIHDLIEAGAEVIFVTPVEWISVREGLEEAKRAGVPVIVVDTPVMNSELVACSVVSNNYQAGVLCAEHLLRNRQSANILLLEHVTARSGYERIQGFRDTIRGHAGFEIVGQGESDGQIENAMPVLAELLKQHPEADTVMALNDPSAFGALAALEDAERLESFFVYGVDGSPEAKALVYDRLMTGTCAQFPYRVASTAAIQAYTILSGNPVEHEIVIPVELITQKNLYLFDVTGWQ